jgi:hypothetical protein
VRICACSKKINGGSGGVTGWLGFLLLALFCLVAPARATDVYGTFALHIVEVTTGGSDDSPCNTTITLTSSSGNFTYPCERSDSRATISPIAVEISTPAFTPRGVLVGNQTLEQGADIDFDGSVPLTTRASVTVTHTQGFQTWTMVRAAGRIDSTRLTGTNQTFEGQVPIPEKLVPLPNPGSATATTEGSANVEIAMGGVGSRLSGPPVHSVPPTTRLLAITSYDLGFARNDGRFFGPRVTIYTYYDFSTEPKFPKIDVEGLSPAECTPNAGAAMSPLAPIAADVCTPPSVSFGTVPVNVGRQRIFYIANKGDGPLDIQTIDLEPKTGSPLNFEVQGPLLLGVGKRLQVKVFWRPLAVENLQDLKAELTMRSNDLERPIIVIPILGQSDGRPGYVSEPPVGKEIDFGVIETGVEAYKLMIISNDGTVDFQINNIELSSLSEPGLRVDLGGLSFPATMAPGEGIIVDLFWKPESATELTHLDELTVVTTEPDDPDPREVNYRIRGTSKIDPIKALEKIFFGWLFDDPGPARNQAKPASTAATIETATLTLDPAVAPELTAEVPPFLGGGSVQFNSFSGDITVSLISIPGDSQYKQIRIDGGLLTAPSVQLPGGLSTGLNTLTFGQPEESGGTLDVATGNYTAHATGTIYNQLIPSGFTVRGNYSGIYNAQSKKISVQSNSEDLFVPKDQPLNISTRMRVLAGDNVLIGGFIIVGDEAKRVIIRGIGPSLTGLAGTLADPTLVLRQGSTVIATNDNWKEREAEVLATTIPPSNNNESAIVTTLQPGAYTAVLAGKNNGTGVGVVEVYDLARGADSRLANISSRGFVDTGNNVMIGGLIIGSPVVVNGVSVPQGGARAMVRAIGPSLGDAGVQNTLQDPTLELRDGNGALIEANDNWRSDHEAEIVATTIPPARNEESAIVRTLPAGSYTAIVRGVNNTTGIALVEVYNLQ